MSNTHAWADRIRTIPSWKKNTAGAVIGLALGGLIAASQLAGGPKCSPTSYGQWTAGCSTITTVVDAPLGKLLISINADVVEVTPGLARSEFEKIYTSIVPTRFKVRDAEYVYDDTQINAQFPMTIMLGGQELTLQPSDNGTWRAEGSSTASATERFDGVGEARLNFNSLFEGRISLELPSSGMAAAWAALD